MELLVHVNKRLKSRSKIQLPVEALLALFQDPAATPFVTVSKINVNIVLLVLVCDIEHTKGCIYIYIYISEYFLMTRCNSVQVLDIFSDCWQFP